MLESQKDAQLELRWIAVVDARGREHLEARWVDLMARHVDAHHAA